MIVYLAVANYTAVVSISAQPPMLLKVLKAARQLVSQRSSPLMLPRHPKLPV